MGSLESGVAVRKMGVPSNHHAAEIGSRPAAPPRPSLGERLVESRVAMLLALLLAVVPLGAYALVYLPLEAHLGLSVGLMGAGLLVLRRFPRLRIAAMLLSVAASVRYLYWRGSETLFLELTPDGALSLALFGAELYGFLILLGGYFQTAIVRNRVPAPLPADPQRLPSVDIYIPTYNEPIDVLRRTAVGAQAISYPKKTVYILDDTPREHRDRKRQAALDARREAVAELAREIGCTALRRPDNRGAKAGNINHALTKTSGDLIAIFDADHVPVRTFLQATVGFFVESKKVALVQTPHHFYNPDPFERNLFSEGRLPPEQHLFYHRIQKGNDFWNSAFFCGSCAVIRREALEEVGGIAQETVTEDAHTALKLHARGWESRYIDIPQAAGLATERFGFHVQQRIRWARGMVQILRRDNPLFKRGLKLAQRLNYLNAASHFLFGVPRLIYLTAPAAYLLLSLHPLNADVREVLIYALPHLFLAAACGASVNQNTRFSFWPEVFETSIAWYTARVTTVALFLPKFGSFNVTPKGESLERAEFDWRNAMPMLLLYGLALVALFVWPVRIASTPSQWGTIAVAGIWNLYNLIILSAGIAVALERPQRRRFTRIRCSGWVAISSGGEAEGPVVPVERIGELIDLSEGGAHVLLDSSEPIPDTIRLTLTTPSGVSTELIARAVAQVEDGEDRLRVGLEFVEVSPEQRMLLIEQMFSEPDSWLRERFAEDNPLRSALDVLAAPLIVLFNHLLGRNPHHQHRGAPLTPFHSTVRCPECYSPQLAVLSTCGKCGAVMPEPEPEEAAEVTSFTERVLRSVRGLVAAPLLALAAVIAVGWKPIVDPLNAQLDAVREAGSVTPSRVGELLGAHRELSRLKRQLDWALLPLAPSLPLDWSKRLWSSRYGYELNRGDDPDWAQVVGTLDRACLELEQAGRDYRAGAEERVIEDRLGRVDEYLDAAAKGLALAMQEERS